MGNDRIDDRADFDLTLLANFVHQVINPLNGVIGTLDNLVDGTIHEERRKQRTAAARAQLEGCVNLLRNLAFLVRSPHSLESGDKKTVVLPQIIIEEAGNRDLKIELLDKKTQNCCSAHPELIRQVLMNIFDNCTKYSKSGTRILVEQWIQKSTNNAMVTIQNTPSHSIDPDDLERMFDRGFRGDNAKQAVASGTGLGMYICKQIIEDMHGGKLKAGTDKGDLKLMIRIPEGRVK